MNTMYENLTIIGFGKLGSKLINRLNDYQNYLGGITDQEDGARNTERVALYTINDVNELNEINSTSLKEKFIVVIAEKLSVELINTILQHSNSSFLIGITKRNSDDVTVDSKILFQTEEEAFLSAKVILDILTVPSAIGVDPADLTILLEKSRFFVEYKSVPIDYQNDNKPLFKTIEKVNSILLTIYGPEEMSMLQVCSVIDGVTPFLNKNAKFIFTEYTNSEVLKDKLNLVCLMDSN